MQMEEKTEEKEVQTEETKETGKRKKKEKKKKPGKREKQEKVKTAGLHRKRVVFLWILFVAAFAFAVYKNFTAIDRVTTVKTERVDERIVSTQSIEEYARSFVEVYFTWSPESVSERSEKLEAYLNPDLLRYAKNMLPASVENSSWVESDTVWNVEKENDQEYQVVIKLGQIVGGSEGEKYVDAVYEVWVYVDENGDMTITKLPTYANIPGRSSYEKRTPAEADNLTADEKEEIQEFLNDFFQVYPTSTEKELKYYADEYVMPVIGSGDFELVSIEDVVISAMKGGKATVTTSVGYLQVSTGTKQTFQYTLRLEKTDTWKIVSMQ